MQTSFVWASIVLTIAASLLLVFVPTESTSSAQGFAHRTLMEVNGQRVIILLLIPVVIALAPVVFPGLLMRRIATTLLGAFSVVSSFSVGFFFIPAAIAMLIAASGKTQTSASIGPR
jgi:hypothetical protein